jgi:hypothetical protein
MRAMLVTIADVPPKLNLRGLSISSAQFRPPRQINPEHILNIGSTTLMGRTRSKLGWELQRTISLSKADCRFLAAPSGTFRTDEISLASMRIQLAEFEFRQTTLCAFVLKCTSRGSYTRQANGPFLEQGNRI